MVNGERPQRPHLTEDLNMAPNIDGSTGQHSRGILSGLNIVECGEGVAAAFATKMMADLGANVIKVEPINGDVLRQRGPFPKNIADPEKSGLFLYLNNNKRGVTLDLAQPDARRRRRPPQRRRAR